MRNDSFSPSSLTVRAGRDYILELRNKDGKAYNLRIAGLDGKYDTEDDLVSDNVDPGKTGSMALRIDQPGSYDFRSDSEPISMVGTLTVWEAPPIAALPSPTPRPTPSPSPTGEAESPSPPASPAGE
jgi:plastocyanin